MHLEGFLSFSIHFDLARETGCENEDLRAQQQVGQVHEAETQGGLEREERYGCRGTFRLGGDCACARAEFPPLAHG